MEQAHWHNRTIETMKHEFMYMYMNIIIRGIS